MNAYFVNRHSQSAAVSQLMLLIFQEMDAARANGELPFTLPQWRALCVVRLNDERGGLPLSIRQIAKQARIPKSSVQRMMRALVKHKAVKIVVVRRKQGYVGDDTFLEARVEAGYFKNIVREILACAALLNQLQ